jgi:hypothetical protein
MRLTATTYVSPNPQEGTFTNVVIEDTSYQIKRQKKSFRVDFSMFLESNPEIILDTAYLEFTGMNTDTVNSNRKTTFRFNNDPVDQEPTGLIEYLTLNAGVFPTNYTMVDWGFPSFEDALTYLTGGSLSNPELNPVSNFVKEWLLYTVGMKWQKIGEQFTFVD